MTDHVVTLVVRSADVAPLDLLRLRAELQSVPEIAEMKGPVPLSPSGDTPPTCFLFFGSMPKDRADSLMARHALPETAFTITAYVTDPPVNPVPSAEWYEGFCVGRILAELGLRAMGTMPRSKELERATKRFAENYEGPSTPGVAIFLSGERLT